VTPPLDYRTGFAGLTLGLSLSTQVDDSAIGVVDEPRARVRPGTWRRLRAPRPERKPRGDGDLALNSTEDRVFMLRRAVSGVEPRCRGGLGCDGALGWRTGSRAPFA